jgi:hypothetical protein
MGWDVSVDLEPMLREITRNTVFFVFSKFIEIVNPKIWYWDKDFTTLLFGFTSFEKFKKKCND